ncbi:MAG: hypothetical protein K6G90_03405 [Clostridia bacterium]|nr:hypothetical protein [Clostridia bacterium]
MKELRDLLEILSWFISFAKTFLNAFGIQADFVDDVTGFILSIAGEEEAASSAG